MSAETYYKVPERQLREFIRAANENAWHNSLEEYGEEWMNSSSLYRELDDDEITQRLLEFEEVEE